MRLLAFGDWDYNGYVVWGVFILGLGFGWVGGWRTGRRR